MRSGGLGRGRLTSAYLRDCIEAVGAGDGREAGDLTDIFTELDERDA